MLIDEECGILEVVIDGGEFTKNINQKKSDVLRAFIFPLNIVNQLVNMAFFVGSYFLWVGSISFERKKIFFSSNNQRLP